MKFTPQLEALLIETAIKVLTHKFSSLQLLRDTLQQVLDAVDGELLKQH